MSRLVDADALSKLVGEPIEVFLRRLDLKLPLTVDAEPVKHGHWTNISVSVTGNSSAECSLCGTVVHDTFADVNRINYCPNCGAKMDEVEDG